MNWQYRTGETKGEKKTQGSIKWVEHEPNHRDPFGSGIRKEVTMNAIKNEAVLQQTKKPARRNHTNA